MADKEWDPDAPSPEDLQKKQIELGEKFLAKIEAQEAADRAAKEAYEKDAHSPRRVAAISYTAPTFEEVSAVLKKAWDEVEKIMPTAGDRVKAAAFQSLTHAAAPHPGSFLG